MLSSETAVANRNASGVGGGGVGPRPAAAAAAEAGGSAALELDLFAAASASDTHGASWRALDMTCKGCSFLSPLASPSTGMMEPTTALPSSHLRVCASSHSYATNQISLLACSFIYAPRGAASRDAISTAAVTATSEPPPPRAQGKCTERRINKSSLRA